jgi:hypothetical protein
VLQSLLEGEVERAIVYEWVKVMVFNPCFDR